MFGLFFFLTLFLQKIMGFSPLRAGVAFLPMTITLFAVSRLAPRQPAGRHRLHQEQEARSRSRRRTRAGGSRRRGARVSPGRKPCE